MTAVLSALAGFTAWDWACILTAWVALGLVLAVALGRAIRRADESEPRDDDTVVTEYPPLLPPIVVAEPTWAPDDTQPIPLDKSEFVVFILPSERPRVPAPAVDWMEHWFMDGAA